LWLEQSQPIVVMERANRDTRNFRERFHSISLWLILGHSNSLRNYLGA
jgi:hypothetical protein